MGVIYNPTVRTARMGIVRDAIDAGAGPGKIKIYTAADLLLGTLICSDPAGSVSGDVYTFNPITSDASADNAGTAAKATVTDSADTVVVSGLTVGTSGANINLNSVVVSAGAAISLTSGSFTHNTVG